MVIKAIKVYSFIWVGGGGTYLKNEFRFNIFFFKQMALAPYRNLPQEIESLKLVIEIRNEEIQKLKNRNVELEKQVGLLELFKF